MQWLVEVLDISSGEVEAVTVVARSATAAGLVAVHSRDRQRHKVGQVEEAGRWPER